MKKNYSQYFHLNKALSLTKICLVLFITWSSTSIAQVTYCSASATNASDDEIFNVTIGTLNNTTSCGSLGGGNSVASLYNDYTSLPAPVLYTGTNYSLAVTVGQCNGFAYSGYVGVWIDYNQNGVFTDPGENVYLSSSTTFSVSGTTVSPPFGVTIPAAALSGKTRMRVIAKESSVPTPCGTFGYGEVEDYTLLIIPPTALDLGVSLFLKPLNTKKCLGTDTIITRITNYGTSGNDFSITPAVITVQSTGANNSTYTLAVNSGTIGTGASKDYTLTTAYMMNALGNYKLKGFTTIAGDAVPEDDTLKITLTKKPYFTTTIFPNDTVCEKVPVQLNVYIDQFKQVGFGTLTNSSFTYPTPYGNYYEGAKHHFLILASELTASGLVAGNFTSLAFNSTNLNGINPLKNYNISIATTTLSNLTGYSTQPFTSYYSVPSYTPVIGLNKQTLSTPFAWDGISNIVIKTCFDNTSTGFSSNVSVEQTATSFTSSVWEASDATPGICSNTLATNSMMQRPNFYFEQLKPVSYTWSPAIGLTSTTISNPISNLTTTLNIPTTQTYTISTVLAGCYSYDTIRLFVKPTPIPRLGIDTTLCSLPFTLKANVVANSYLWNTGSTNATIPINTSGQYWAKTTGTNNCSYADTINIVVSSYPIVTLGNDTSFCAGSSINLYCGNSGSSILWNTGANTPFITVNSVGTYSVLVTNSAGCKKSDVVNVGTRSKPSVSLAFTGQTHFCPTNSNPRPLTEGTPSGGTYIGSGVSGNNFIPSQANQGTYVIIYNYTGSNGCSNSATDVLVVDACVGVEELENNLGLNVYPNPNTGDFTLEINAATSINAQLDITTIDGRVVFAKTISGEGLLTEKMDITNLANGIYYLRLQSKDVVRTFKVLKQ